MTVWIMAGRFLRRRGVWLAIIAPAVLAIACSFAGNASGDAGAPSPAPSPTPDLAAELPFEGVWWGEEGKVLVLTPTTFYTHENEGDYDRQVFGEILGYDLDAGRVDYRMVAIYINGEPGGFDSPTKYLTFHRNGDELRVMTGDAGFDPTLEETFTLR
jgi:hypothetical protein